MASSRASSKPGARPAAALQSPSSSSAALWSALHPPIAKANPRGPHLVGVLTGEGVGPEVIAAALDVLDAAGEVAGVQFDLRRGGPIGLAARLNAGVDLTDDVTGFCDGVFADGGAVLCGPGGGRFVYDLRGRFDLYCKLAPIRPVTALRDAGVMRPESVDRVDIVVVRENVGGAYFGEHTARRSDRQLREAHHRYGYSAEQVARILRVALDLARLRRNKLAVVVKPSGVPSISELWIEQARTLSAGTGVELELIEVDNACYQVVAAAPRFDVVVAPNLFGDIVADTAALVLGSRGLSFSANFGDNGRAVYQTGHGAAHDLAGRDAANPIGQIRSLAMMLHESFGLAELRGAIERSIEAVVAEGWRTADMMTTGCTRIGTQELGRRIAERTRTEFERVRSPSSGNPALEVGALSGG